MKADNAPIADSVAPEQISLRFQRPIVLARRVLPGFAAVATAFCGTSEVEFLFSARKNKIPRNCGISFVPNINAPRPFRLLFDGGSLGSENYTSVSRQG